MNIYVRCCLFLSLMQYAHGMQQIKQHPIVRGDVFIIMNGIYYCSHFDYFFENLVDENGTQLPKQPNDIAVPVWTTSKVCDNWGSRNHPQLSVILDKLPLFLLEGKHEGDVIAFYVKNPQTKEIFDVRLTCNQLSYRYKFNSFQNILKNLIQGFLNRPILNENVLTDYLKPLLDDGIIIRNPKYDKNDTSLFSQPKYIHGPNGYQANAPCDPRSRDDYEVIEEESGDLHIVHAPK